MLWCSLEIMLRLEDVDFALEVAWGESSEKAIVIRKN
jgi:hypothetical protein